MEEIKIGKTRVYPKRTGTKAISVIQVIFLVASVILLIAGIFNAATPWYEKEIPDLPYFSYAFMLFILCIALIPLRPIIKAAEYYIAVAEDQYDVDGATGIDKG